MNQFLDQLNADIRSSYCEHKEVEYEYENIDGHTVMVGAYCLDCDKEITDLFSDKEKVDMGLEEQISQTEEYYDSLREDGYAR